MLTTGRETGSRTIRWTAIAAILIAPAIAMQFTREMTWDAADFALLAMLLVGAGLAYELAAAKLRHPLHRAVAGLAAAGAVLVVWADAAIGIF